jgi:Type I phosphodiesterase / nucleotide pyrophosphatase
VRRLRSAASITALAVIAGATAATAATAPASPRERSSSLLGDTASLVPSVCALGSTILQRIANGTQLGRSGQIQIVPRAPNFVSGGLSHAGPFDYLQRVPMLWYGPGFIRPGFHREPVTLADVAPTEGAILHYPFAAPDGHVLPGVVDPSASDVPRLVVTLVWDAAGRDVLDAWPHDWPYLKSLTPRGAWFDDATVGASPSNTPPGHAIIGTGAFPSRTGLVDEFMSLGDVVQKPFDDGPGSLLLPTLGDLYDRAMGNRPIVGTVATLDTHVGMMSHGSMWGGGDGDIAVTRELEGSVKGGAEGLSWNLTPAMARFYRLPPYVNDVPGFSRDIAALDRADGQLDGRWRQNSIEQLNNGFDTPARTPYQTRLIEAIVKREGFGRDRVPDLLYLNYKAIDTIGHIFSLNSPEMKDAIDAQDPDLRRLVDFLNRRVGTGRWAMVLVADHGHQYDPTVSGAFEIGIDQLEADIVKRFDDDGDGTPLIEWVRPTEIWLDTSELRQNGYDLTEVSRYIAQLTEAQTSKPGVPIQLGHADDAVFSAAFPSAMLDHLPCLKAAA